MLFRQIIHEDLGCGSYLVGDERRNVAAVVDPQWDIDPYLRLARLHGMRIEHVLETHNHADHVSGHGRLARATGATIHIHELAEAEYEHQPFADGWKLGLEELEIEALHTPGHRPEHTSFLLRDLAEGAHAWAVLTGDSLFVGDVARPDLAIEPRDGAAGIFRSLHERLLILDDAVEVWPGHLGGSLCGSAGIANRASSTIGMERRHNDALGHASLEEFVEATTASIGDRPPHADRIVALNRGRLIEDLGAPTPLSPRAVEVAIAQGAVLVDARTNEQFDEAHIPGAISASAYDTGFATKVAWVADEEAHVILVAASDGYELEAASLLASVGLRVGGYLEGGMTAWRSEGRPVKRVEMIDPDDLAARLAPDRILVLDVRDDHEFAAGHIPGATHIPYGQLIERLGELPRDRAIAAVCSGGKRSGLAASLLQREGFERVLHVGRGGVGTWRDAGHPVSRGDG
ncbi:MAG TPA: rhodanese-like domain-containing protein [Solirubrobacterales bacterium]|nr:rhodanese-like domain-containing protein [Solirubrobacterales bacterium]